MNSWIGRTVVLASVLCVHSWLAPQGAAGPLADWLSGRSPYYEPHSWTKCKGKKQPRTPARTTLPPPPTQFPGQPVIYYPTSVVSQPPAAVTSVPSAEASPTVQPTPNFQQPATVSAAPMVGTVSCGPPVVIPQQVCVQRPVTSSGCCSSSLTSWWPRRTYRSSWVRVPTTRYRTVIGTTQIAYGNPATQPCNGYNWQLRRVPSSCFRWPWEWGCRQPVTQQPVAYFGNPMVDPCAVYGTTVVPVAPTESPYYPAPPAPSSGTTMVPAASLGATPQPLAPTVAPPAAGGTPADYPPSLSPNGIAPNGYRSQMVPRPPSAAAVPPAEPSPTPAPPAGGEAGQTTGGAGEEPARQRTPAPPSGTGGRGSSLIPGSPEHSFPPGGTTYSSAPQPTRPTGPESSQRAESYFNVNPIRDPESAANRKGFDTVPRLLRPDNHSAANDRRDPVRAWQIVPIAWEKVERTLGTAEPPTGVLDRLPAAPAAVPVRPADFDDGGWKTAR